MGKIVTGNWAIVTTSTGEKYFGQISDGTPDGRIVLNPAYMYRLEVAQNGEKAQVNHAVMPMDFFLDLDWIEIEKPVAVAVFSEAGIDVKNIRDNLERFLREIRAQRSGLVLPGN